MKKITHLSTICLIALFLFSCKKDNLQIKEGSYKGTFTVIYSSGTHSGSTTVELKNGRFSCAGNSNKIPAGASGSYTIDKNVITFSDENPHTAEFDWGLILNGRYDYTFDGTNLNLERVSDGIGKYTYRLKIL
ncbi:hypothetical protein SAMN05660841_02576 [Sphingobacterium nematocida]|uniref:Lipocalin-like domain-containing protein n=1 Tax=Sphingobacterium nematocida TaxID=1513896 RepID=A0A1T5EGR4_9SPHI|nr:hypothetical protein [Sphingobacterium nematocida]SKB83233.1 hypothetical protein SAMN05660841_02576 [Sphingobacterium nematocida]